ncbi:MAG: TadE family protein, partial [Chloroflexota bacterium]
MTEIRTGAKRPFKQRQGQTLVEFAITLPILLVLLFGIIEFGRIFQAWIAVQNASRVAARYASTGQYDRAFEEYISDDSI